MKMLFALVLLAVSANLVASNESAEGSIASRTRARRRSTAASTPSAPQKPARSHQALTPTGAADLTAAMNAAVAATGSDVKTAEDAAAALDRLAERKPGSRVAAVWAACKTRSAKALNLVPSRTTVWSALVGCCRRTKAVVVSKEAVSALAVASFVTFAAACPELQAFVGAHLPEAVSLHAVNALTTLAVPATYVLSIVKSLPVPFATA